MVTRKRLALDYDKVKKQIRIERPLQMCAMIKSPNQLHLGERDNPGIGKPYPNIDKPNSSIDNSNKPNPIAYSSVILDDYQQQQCFSSVCEYHFDFGDLLQQSNSNKQTEPRLKQNMQHQANLRYMTHTKTSQTRLKANKNPLKSSILQPTANSHKKQQQIAKHHEKRGPIIDGINKKYHCSQQISMLQT